jgi:hypothetical protein
MLCWWLHKMGDKDGLQVWNLQWWKIIHLTSQEILHKKFSSVQKCVSKQKRSALKEVNSTDFNIKFSDIEHSVLKLVTFTHVSTATTTISLLLQSNSTPLLLI